MEMFFHWLVRVVKPLSIAFCCPSINNIYLHEGISDDHPSYKKTRVVMKIKPLNPQNDQLSIGLLAQLVEP